MKEKLSTSKLLFFVLCLQLVAVSVGVVSDQFSNDAWLHWIERGFTVAAFYFWFQLGRENRIYRWTSVFKTVYIGFTVAGWLISLLFRIVALNNYSDLLLQISSVVTWAANLVFLPAIILECLAHGKIAPAVRKGWIAFLIIQLAWLVIGSAVSQIAGAQFEAQVWSVEILNGVNEGMQLINLAVQLFLLWLLYRTFRIVKANETE